MRVRHRIPSIFNLSMVDVLCCALGCVILLWLLNLRAAKEYEDNAAEESRQTSALLRTAQEDRDGAYTVISALDSQIMALEEKRSALQKRLAAQEAASRELEEKLKQSGARVAALEEDLDANRRQTKSLKKTADLVPGLQADLKALEQELAQRRQEMDETAKSLQTLQASKRALERNVSERDKELMDARSYKEKWAAAADLLRAREKELAEAGRSLDALQQERRTLLAEAGRTRALAESRFAGIQLTGRRVVFLVDTSGSMELVDENTEAPHKWPEVARTVARLMRSLPDLEKYQVIIFAEKASFLLESSGRWLDFDPKTTPERVEKALLAHKPSGGTNMYAALDAAFRLRRDGLDTVYLLSDGLPNMGEGLKPAEAKGLTEVQLGDILGKYVRKKLKNDWNRELKTQPRVRINAIGFFYESPDVGAFLWALARENDGSFVGMSRP
jgi:hypothetical protein